MNLPIIHSTDQDLQLIQTKWAAILNALLSNPSIQNNILSNIALKTGTNVINHLLARKLQGYRIILRSAQSSIYDQQLTNQTPDKTLILVASAPVTVSIEVF